MIRVVPELARLLPNAEQSAVLRAAVGDRAVAAEAWVRWCREAGSRAPSAAQALAPYKDLLPLLAWNLGRHAIASPPAIATCLQFARLTEKLRDAKYRDICRAVFQRLDDAGTPFLVLKGAALAEHVYPSTALRHCGDIDLMLGPEHLHTAWRAIAASGWSALPGTWPRIRHLPRLLHGSGLPVELHRQLLIHYYRLDFGGLWARRQTVTVAGCQVSMLSNADALIHACAHGLSHGVNPRWVPDAWLLIAHGVDWSALVEHALAARLSLPLSAALGYLSSEIGDVVPADVLRSLEEAARRSGRHERAAALLALRGTQPSLREIWSGATRWTDRLRFSRPLLLPAPVAVAAEFGLSPWQMPAYYVANAWHYLARVRQPAVKRASRIG